MERKEYKVLIVDDEVHARKKMERLLSAFSDMKVVGTAGDGEAALNEIVTKEPDIVFLDIEMPGLTGIEVADAVTELEKAPKIIFTTAYEEHAVKAFELNAIDYLLKPFNKDRLEQALQKVKENPTQTVNKKALKEVRKGLPESLQNRLPVLVGDRFKLININAIQTLEIHNRTLNIYTAKNHYVVRETLESIVHKIQSPDFFQVSRSAVINLKYIKEIIFWEGNRFKVLMQNGREVLCSRDKTKEIRKLLNI